MPLFDQKWKTIDWRGWLTLVWVVYFGFLYGKMVIERRGDKIRAVISARP